MKRRPRNPKESILNKPSLEFIVVVGIIIAGLTFYLFFLELPDIDRARTMAFSALVIFEMAVAISFRSPEYLFSTKIAKNNKLWIAILLSVILQFMIVYLPFFNSLFHTVPLGLEDWGRIFTGAFVIFMAIEINKVLRLQRHIYKIKAVAVRNK
jgi:Ca2+-transporting ATPase